MKTTLLLIMLMSTMLTQPTLGQGDFPSLEGLQAENILDLNIYASAPSKPALKYRLYDYRLNAINRNAAIYYHRALMELRTIDSVLRLRNATNPNEQIADLYDDEGRNYEKWIESALEDAPIEDMRAWSDRYAEVISEMRRAKNSSFCDWQILPAPGEKMHINWIAIRMDDVQGMRAISRMLAVAIRVKLADGNFAEAIELFELGFTLAYDVQESESAVGSLIGIACVGHMQEQLVTMIGLPDAPNVFWPLIDQPQSLDSTRRAVRREMAMLTDMQDGPLYGDPALRKLSPEGWQDLFVADLMQLLDYSYSAVPDRTLNDLKFAVQKLAFALYPKARKFLIESGYENAAVEEMPTLQAIAIYQKHDWEQLRDQVTKSLNLPIPALVKEVAKTEMALSQPYQSTTLSPLSMYEMSLPPLQQVVFAEIRVQRQMAAVRVIEAIRAYAAEWGALPKSLAEIEILPVPNNPVTGKEFAYRIRDGVGELADFGLMDHSRTLYRIRLMK